MAYMVLHNCLETLYDWELSYFLTTLIFIPLFCVSLKIVR